MVRGRSPIAGPASGVSARTSVDVITGRPIQRSREFRGTRAGAEKALQRFRAELENSPARKQNPGSRLVLSDVIEAHLAASA